MLSAAAVVSIVVILVFLVHDVFWRTIYIEPIAVPETLAKGGYGPDVAARRLQDALNRLRTPAQAVAPAHVQERPVATSASGSDIDLVASSQQLLDTTLPSDLPSIVIPGFGASLDSVAMSIQSFLSLHDYRLKISGEFTIVGNRLWLVLRTNHEVIFANDQGGDPERPDLLLDQAAIRLFDKADPGLGAIIHNNSGNTKHRDGKTDEAIAEYRKALSLDPNNGTVHSNLGNALSDQGKPEEAIAEFRAAIALNPKSAAPHNNLGNALSDQGKLEEAIAEYRATITLDPKSVVPHYNLGNALSAQGNPEEAIGEYRAAIALDPKSALPHINLGAVLSAQGKPEEAIAEFRAAIALDPKKALLHYNLGVVLSDRGKPEEAIAEYRAAIALDPEYALPHNNLGMLLRDEGMPEGATAEYRAAIALDPKLAAPHYNLGILLRDEAGKKSAGERKAMLTEACRHFVTGAALAPKDPGYAAAVQSIDALLAGDGHCPPP